MIGRASLENQGIERMTPSQRAGVGRTTGTPILVTAIDIPPGVKSDVKTTDLGLLKNQKIGIQDEENVPLKDKMTVTDITVVLRKTRSINPPRHRAKITIPTLTHSRILLGQRLLRNRLFAAVGVATTPPCRGLTVVLRPIMTQQST